MPAGIANYDFISFKGGLGPTGENLEEITRPNVDGIAYRKTGKRALPFQMISTVDVDSAEDAKDLLLDYKLLQGSLWTIEDDTGKEWENVAVIEIEHLYTRKIEGAVGGVSTNKEYLMACRWSLQMTEHE